MPSPEVQALTLGLTFAVSVLTLMTGFRLSMLLTATCALFSGAKTVAAFVAVVGIRFFFA